MTVNFFLDSKIDKQNRKALLCFVRGIESGKTIYLPTGIKIPLQSWEKTKQRVVDHKFAKEFNNQLLNMEHKIVEHYSRLELEGSNLTFKFIEAELKKLFSKKQEKIEKTFFDYFTQFIESRRNEVIDRTALRYVTLQNHLIRFEKQYKYPLRFDTITHEFREKFIDYSYKICKHSTNYTFKSLKVLKVFLRWAEQRGYNKTTTYKQFKIKEIKIDIVYLTNEELNKLVKMDFSHNEKLDKYRDIFCFTCYTGIRYSDIKNMKFDEINDGFWNLNVTKTLEIIKIPIIPQAMRIISKYKETANTFPKINYDDYKVMIKEVCKLAGLDEPVTLVKNIAGQKVSVRKPKYEFIKSHAGRRTFIILSLEKGMRVETLMKITGHKDYRTLMRYVKIASKVTQQEALEAWREEDE